MSGLITELAAFIDANGMAKTRGALNVGLVVTRRARELGLPIDPERLLSKSGGQVAGLSGAAGDRILRDYGVTRSIGTEVGRTNRGSIDQMRRYVGFLNALAAEGPVDFQALEAYWAELFQKRFASEPFKLRRDQGVGVQFVVRDLISQAEARQKEAGGATIVGTVMQHLVGAKLAAVFGERLTLDHHGANVSDAGGRGGDFDIGDAAIHVTSAPGELLISKCIANIEAGVRPIIITTARGLAAADFIAEQRGVRDRIELIEIEQFVATNVLELGNFSAAASGHALRRIVDRYNEIIEACEPDLSLKINSDGRRSG